MSKVGQMILRGAREALAFAKGEADPSAYRIHVPPEVDVKALRGRLDLSQEEFARRFGFTAARVRDWEQGRSKPDGAIRAYLIVIEREPEAVKRALLRTQRRSYASPAATVRRRPARSGKVA